MTRGGAVPRPAVPPGAAGPAGGAAPDAAPASPLRQVLREIRAASGGGVSLDEVARRVGVERDEVDAMVDYWVRRGRLAVSEIGRGCPAGGCGACPAARRGAAACGAPATGGPALVAITVSDGPG